MARTFTYRFENSDYEIESPALSRDALDIMEAQFGKCTYNGWAEFMGVGQPSSVAIVGGAHSRGDAFKTGWNPALGMEIKSPEHFKRTLKEKGLVETGNEKPREHKIKTKSYITEDVIKEAVSMGAEISDAAADRLIEGKSLDEN